MTWAVVGASGFVGSAVAAELRGRGLDVVEVAAPRLESTAANAAGVLAQAGGWTTVAWMLLALAACGVWLARKL